MIPLPTTTITVQRRPDDEGDPYEPPDFATVLEGVRAHISVYAGSEEVAGASQEVVSYRLACDPIDLRHTDRILDENTGETYEVVWAFLRAGLPPLNHTTAGLKTVRGVV